MYFWANRTPESGWFIDRLELELRSQPEKRFLIKKSQTMKTTVNDERNE